MRWLVFGLLAILAGCGSKEETPESQFKESLSIRVQICDILEEVYDKNTANESVKKLIPVLEKMKSLQERKIETSFDTQKILVEKNFDEAKKILDREKRLVKRVRPVAKGTELEDHINRIWPNDLQ